MIQSFIDIGLNQRRSTSERATSSSETSARSLAKPKERTKQTWKDQTQGKEERTKELKRHSFSKGRFVA
jgi:hypothetical protein